MHGQVYFYEMATLVLSLLCMDKFISMKWRFWHYHCYAWTSFGVIFVLFKPYVRVIVLVKFG